MLKDGNLQVAWEDGELVISFLDEDYEEDQYVVDPESAYELCKFLVKKFSKRLKADLRDKIKA
jgi:hypothetical protein